MEAIGTRSFSKHAKGGRDKKASPCHNNNSVSNCWTAWWVHRCYCRRSELIGQYYFNETQTNVILRNDYLKCNKFLHIKTTCKEFKPLELYDGQPFELLFSISYFNVSCGSCKKMPVERNFHTNTKILKFQ